MSVASVAGARQRTSPDPTYPGGALMSQSNVVRLDSRSNAPAGLQTLCSRADLVANSGVVAPHDGARAALFHLLDNADGEQLFAIENRDPKSGANVIGRGIVGSPKGELVIASPLYKQHFRPADGSCPEYPEQRWKVWPVRPSATRYRSPRADRRPLPGTSFAHRSDPAGAALTART